MVDVILRLPAWGYQRNGLLIKGDRLLRFFVKGVGNQRDPRIGMAHKVTVARSIRCVAIYHLLKRSARLFQPVAALQPQIVAHQTVTKGDMAMVNLLLSIATGNQQRSPGISVRSWVLRSSTLKMVPRVPSSASSTPTNQRALPKTHSDFVNMGESLRRGFIVPFLLLGVLQMLERAGWHLAARERTWLPLFCA